MFRRWLAQRRTEAESRILNALLDLDRDTGVYGGFHFGLDLMRSARLRPGRFYPNMRRLEQLGVVEAKWEELEPGEKYLSGSSKYRRRLYGLAITG